MSIVGGDTRTLQVIRRVLGLLLLVAGVGTFVELLLLGHDEDGLQLIPLALLVGGVVTLVWTLFRPATLAVAAFRIVMVVDDCRRRVGRCAALPCQSGVSARAHARRPGVGSVLKSRIGQNAASPRARRAGATRMSGTRIRLSAPRRTDCRGSPRRREQCRNSLGAASAQP